MSFAQGISIKKKPTLRARPPKDLPKRRSYRVLRHAPEALQGGTRMPPKRHAKMDPNGSPKWRSKKVVGADLDTLLGSSFWSSFWIAFYYHFGLPKGVRDSWSFWSHFELQLGPEWLPKGMPNGTPNGTRMTTQRHAQWISKW